MSLPIQHSLVKKQASHLEPIKNNKHKTLSLAVCAVMLGSTVLVGCQSNPTPIKNSGKAMIDFSVADSRQNQAQAQSFNTALNANDERYEQLFDQSQFPSTETQAKTRLIKAIRQHLATEQVAVAQARYYSTPFIKSDSIDAGSTSLLKTVIELYAYNAENQSYSDYDDAEDDSYYEESVYEEDELESDSRVDAADEVVVVEPDADDYDAALEYDAEGYDEYGYDYDGYDRDGYDYDGYDYYGYDINGYDYEGYDEYGYDQDGDYGYSSDDDYEDSGIKDKLDKLNPKGLLKSYEAMQIQKQQASTNKDSVTANEPLTGMLGSMLGMLDRTPEQVQAMNAYQYKNLTFNSVSHYKPEQKQLQSVYSYDYLTPTLSSSIQIPLALDFKDSRITLDPSALMPLAALLNPEHTPLPNEMTAHTVDFGLPESITSQLPFEVIYDALISAVQEGMAELPEDNFSAIDIKGDAFAKEVGATRAVKVYFGSKQSGELLGKVLKHFSQSLDSYVQANPDKYPDDAVLSRAIAKIQLYNKGYQSADIGSLMQLIEAIGPLSFNQVNYYYLDSSDRLLAKQQRLNIGGDLFGQQTAMLNQVRYDKAQFNQHTLTPLLTQSFGVNAAPAIDGNAWLDDQRFQKERLSQARYARYSYDDSDYDSYNDVTEDVADAYESDTDND
ncbi:hypothetical protein [Psychrobacter sp. M13]|uniref:hypothetical protein n=1 Tax=Psychrobacter sp. M13 TaxID=3067275 RepID=UPI00273B214A|nr:hypothetical protein [Psychrobacter sp. M13]WLP95721.1 hypothetical protein Q9G97_06410 [Psychrobacter sp. M13]